MTASRPPDRTTTEPTEAGGGRAVDLFSVTLEDSFVRSLPADPSEVNVPRPVVGACYSLVQPTPVSAPRLLAWSDELAARLGVARPASTGAAVEALAGNRMLRGARPFAACYGGHQFGHWAGQLGDGRAISLGELVDHAGQRWELQLKGAGPTPYSRRADGRAVLRSSIREFLCSEAMHHLGVPTTRALSLVATGDGVVRDMFYDGRPRREPGAIVARVAPSFVRFGNFELHASRGEDAIVRQLADHVIEHHFPDLGAPSRPVYARWFEEICRRTAILLAHWMRVGFVHGVMNTDNMSVLGLTIDYGPYGWLDGYDPDWTPNTTDASGRRYRYGNQPRIALWNLTRLAHALTPLVGDTAELERGLAVYRDTFAQRYREMLAAKLGLARLEGEDDDALVDELFAVLTQVETDMAIFFRALVELSVDASAAARSDAALIEPLRAACYAPEALTAEPQARLAAWLRRYLARSLTDEGPPEARAARMNRANPRFVLRNYLAQQAIEAAEQGDASMVETLLRVMRRPYDEQPAHAHLAAPRPEWARNKPGCSALSCSS